MMKIGLFEMMQGAKALALLVSLAAFSFVGCSETSSDDDVDDDGADDDSADDDFGDDDANDDDTTGEVVLSDDLVLPEEEEYFETVVVADDQLVFLRLGP